MTSFCLYFGMPNRLAAVRSILVLRGRGGSKGGAPAPLLLVHQWKHGEGEGEEEVEERRKNGEMVEEEEISPPFDSVLHPPLLIEHH